MSVINRHNMRCVTPAKARHEWRKQKRRRKAQQIGGSVREGYEILKPEPRSRIDRFVALELARHAARKAAEAGS